MDYVSLGSTDDIGASCHLLMVEGTGLMLDAGVHPDVDGPEGLPRLGLIQSRPDLWVDHVLVSHAHHDHLGALPVVLQRFPHALVHFTKPTRLLAEFLLRASARLQRRRLREGSSTADPLFDEDELTYHEYLYLPHDLSQPFNVTGVRGTSPIQATFYHAGHVLGAAGTLLTFEEAGQKRRVFYTGDVHLRPQVVTPAADLPGGPVDVLIMEATLGADASQEAVMRREEERRFAEALDAVIRRGGVALVPVFALGRSHEMLALIDRFKKRRMIDPDTPVYTSGSMRALAEIYDDTRLISPRLDADLTYAAIDQPRLPRSETALLNILREPGIVLVPSGMMFERTASNDLAQYLVDQEKHAVFLVGYAKPGSPAHRLHEAALQGEGTMVTLDPETGEQPVFCTVDRFRFSGHSHRKDLLTLVDRLRPKTVILVHGEPAAKAWMAEAIRAAHPDTTVVLPEIGVPVTV